MKLEIHNLVALLEDIPEQKLERGDVGSVVKCDLPDDLCEVRFGWSYKRGMVSVTLHSRSLMRLNQAYYEELSLYAQLADHTEYEKKRLEKMQAVRLEEADMYLPEGLRLHDLLSLVCIHRLTDFSPYGIRHRDSADCSCGCRHYVLLEGKEGADWGVCTNPRSPRAGLLTFEHQGCEFFEYDERLDELFRQPGQKKPPV
jgi:hypothetical protein